MNKNLKIKIISLTSMLAISSFVLAGCNTSKSTSSNNSKNMIQSTSLKSGNENSAKNENKSLNGSENKNVTQSTSAKSKNLSFTQAKDDYSFSNFGIRLNKLVSEKIITASQKKIILNLFDKKEITSSNFESQLNSLVAKKIITDSQKSTILHTFKSSQSSGSTVNKKTI